MPVEMQNKGKDAKGLGSPKHGKPPGNNANGGEATRKHMNILKQSVPKGCNVNMSRHDKGDEMTAGRGTRSSMGKGFHQNGQKGDRGSR